MFTVHPKSKTIASTATKGNTTNLLVHTMDLLAGYGYESSDDEDDDNVTKAITAPPAPAKKAAAPAAPAAPPSTSKPKTSTTTTTTKATSPHQRKAQKKGKKLLKLSAVLPEHIWNQLSGGGGVGGLADGEGNHDSDSDDDVYNTGKPSTKATTISSSTTKKPPDAGAATSLIGNGDAGLLGLLQALPKSKHQKGSGSAAAMGMMAANSNSNSKPSPLSSEAAASKATAAAAPLKSAPLGAAFVTSTVETVTRKRRKPGDTATATLTPVKVVDIHATQSSTTLKDVAPPNTTTATTATATASVEPNIMERRWNQQQQPGLPRPGVKPARSSMVLPPPPRPQRHQQPQPMYHAPSQPHYSVSTNSAPATAGRTAGGGKKKPQSRKRQMEQMLRAGRFDEVEEDHQLEMSANVYQPADGFGGGGGGVAHPHDSSHAIRLVPTTSYQAGEGTTAASTDVNFKQKNKHQLNSLLASAASLEAARSQNPLFPSGGGAKSHRASAKRRYGW